MPTKFPDVQNQFTDIKIPLSAWEAWIPANGEPRKLRRPLNESERNALEARRKELHPFVVGYEGREEENRVVLALADMFGSFRSMRQVGQNAAGQIDSARRVLSPFPAWAIEKACASIQLNGVWRNGSFDNQWPPNDSEIAAEVRSKLRLYRDQYDSAVALLNAKVAI